MQNKGFKFTEKSSCFVKVDNFFLAVFFLISHFISHFISIKTRKNKLLKTPQTVRAFKHAAHTTLFSLKLTFFSRSDGN